MKRKILLSLTLFSLVALAGGRGLSQTGFAFEPDTKARLVKMIQRDPEACVELIEQADSLADLRQALTDRVNTEYRAAKIIEAVRALREIELSEEMTLRELQTPLQL